MATIKARAIEKKFPFSPDEEISFCVCRYIKVSGDDEGGVSVGEEFTATGPLLPYAKDCLVTLEGEWTKGRDGLQFTAKNSFQDAPSSYIELQAILAAMPYLDVNSANHIINELGSDALTKLDAHPELFEKFVKGRAARVIPEYNIRRTRKAAFIYLLNKKVAVETAQSIALAVPSLEALKSDPFGYSVGTKLSFNMAKKIAKEENVPSNTLSGAMASIVDVVQQAEGSASGDAFVDGEPSGNTFVEYGALMKKASNQVGLLVQDPLMEQAFKQLLAEEIVQIDQGKYVYRKATADAEHGIAAELTRLNSAPIVREDYNNDIAALECKQKMRLAPEQWNAVEVALNSPVTLLIGGPGTGKTTIERVIIQLYRQFNPDAKVLLVAPTGKAACRMSESTGEPAFTVHKALGVTAGTEVLESNTTLDAGLVLVDEASMLGSQESWALFKAIPTGAQVIIVGDTNQLPSVGAGNVLFELIRSKCFALAQLVTVYRQKSGSTIAVNCARIKLGKTELEYTDTFLMEHASSQNEGAAKILACIRSEMARGLTLDDICVLSPYRKSTPTGTAQINLAIQSEFADKSQSITYGKRAFYIKDKVMFKANRDGAVNGDVGTIIEIDGNKFSVDYGDGRTIQYAKKDLKDFDLAFAITIHKSQGAEYPTCIIACFDEHVTMLKRNLIYTAVSRAKNKVIIVGTDAALEKSIKTEDASVRNSRLAELLVWMKNQPKKVDEAA